MTTYIYPWNEAYRLPAGKRKSTPQRTTLRKPYGTFTDGPPNNTQAQA